jgi:type II restriction enzyme
MRKFSEWLGKMRPSINNYDYYVDFEKVYGNVDAIRVELNIMNSLIGSNNIEENFKALLKRYPEILKCVPILLAVRTSEIYAQDGDGTFNYDFSHMNYSVDQYISFMKKTGLLNLISHHIVNNLVDYALGVETGLDSNGRKNRGGHQMEDLVESFIKNTGVEYYKEMYLADIERKWDVNLSAISAEGTTTKRWDFVVKTASMIYVIETNFYTGGGSKLNETARSYKMIAEEARDVVGVEFVWVTDGGGWHSARRNLEETFNTMDHLYNITDMENGVFLSLFRKEH